jgi:hypothetical protein
MLTEEEARKKWCPYARTLEQDVAFNPVSEKWEATFAGVNRSVQDSDRHRCIASGCMAWRFEPDRWRHKRGGEEWTETRETNGYGGRGLKLPTSGYCGLAGKP